jgi:hypothetical protein
VVSAEIVTTGGAAPSAYRVSQGARVGRANPGDQSVVMLCTVTPDLYIGYFRELAAQPSGPLGATAVGQIMSRYATHVVTARS